MAHIEIGTMTLCRKISTWLFAPFFLILTCQCVLGGSMEAAAVKGITPVGHLDIEGRRFGEGQIGAHQPHECVGPDNLVYAAWFSGGLRVIDISNPYRPEEVACYVPKPAPGFRSAQTNDLFVDAKGLIYTIDRNNGLDILKLSRPGKGKQ